MGGISELNVVLRQLKSNEHDYTCTINAAHNPKPQTLPLIPIGIGDKKNSFFWFFQRRKRRLQNTLRYLHASHEVVKKPASGVTLKISSTSRLLALNLNHKPKCQQTIKVAHLEMRHNVLPVPPRPCNSEEPGCLTISCS